MKRTLVPTGSKKFSSAKRNKRTQVTFTPRYKQPNSNYSRFQKGSGVEIKNIDETAAVWTTASTAWTRTTANDVAQGTSGVTRIGRKILMKSLMIKYYFTGTGATSTGLRCIILYDKQTNGALPAVTDVLTSDTIMAAQNLDNAKRFIILADFYPFDDQSEGMALAGNNGTGVMYKKYIKMNLETMYAGNAGTIADIEMGSLIIMTNGNGATIASQSGIHRIRFIDE